MSDIPFSEFTGILKQLTLEDCSEQQRTLFAALFPRFFDTRSREWSEQARRATEHDPTIVLAQPKQPRRFGGYSLPRSRYYTVCSDAGGADGGTLVHELRAYRAAARTGMVEVMDLGMGPVVLASGERTYSFPRSQELAALIHEPARLGQQLLNVASEGIAGLDGSEARLVRFPYRLSEGTLESVVDLRDPSTRDWFFEQFSKPNDDWIWPESMLEGMKPVDPPKSFVSEYQWSEERAPVPTSFNEMLPTMLNPVRGGGDQAWGGMTLMAIGDWLRNRDVQALIYPSARSDFQVIYKNGALQGFEGWCLVDYRHIESEERNHFVVFDSSPWSWTVWAEHITVRSGREDSELAGSLRLDGAVKQSSVEYKEQVECIKAARANLGELTDPVTARGAYALGTFTLRWLHAALIGASSETIKDAFRTCCGLVLHFDKEHSFRHLRRVYSQVAESGELLPAIEAVMTIAQELQETVDDRAEMQDIVGAAIDLELVLLLLSHSTLSGEAVLKEPMSAPCLRKLEMPAAVQGRIDSFLKLIEAPGNALDECSLAGVELGRALAMHYGH